MTRPTVDLEQLRALQALRRGFGEVQVVSVEPGEEEPWWPAAEAVQLLLQDHEEEGGGPNDLAS